MELSDGTFLYPSGDSHKFIDLLGDTDTTYTLSDNYSEYLIKDSNPLYTRQPIYFRMGISKRWKNQAIVAHS